MGLKFVWNWQGFVAVGIHAFLVLASLIGCLVFLRFKERRYGDRNWTKLEYHSPDDSVHMFEKSGLVYSRVGDLLLKSWAFIVAIGYLFLLVFSFVSLSDTATKATFGGWDELAFAWTVIFTATQIIYGILLYLGDSLNSSFMLPAANMKQATHMNIREKIASTRGGKKKKGGFGPYLTKFTEPNRKV